MPIFLLGLDTEPMEAKSVEALPRGEGWQFEPKWDGFRCLVFKAGQDVDLRAKSGKSLSRYFPEMIEAVRSARADNFLLDGELTVPVGDTLSFGSLQDRVHPAEGRVRKLAAETSSIPSYSLRHKRIERSRGNSGRNRAGGVIGRSLRSCGGDSPHLDVQRVCLPTSIRGLLWSSGSASRTRQFATF